MTPQTGRRRLRRRAPGSLIIIAVLAGLIGKSVRVDAGLSPIATTMPEQEGGAAFGYGG